LKEVEVPCGSLVVLPRHYCLSPPSFLQLAQTGPSLLIGLLRHCDVHHSLCGGLTQQRQPVHARNLLALLLLKLRARSSQPLAHVPCLLVSALGQVRRHTRPTVSTAIAGSQAVWHLVRRGRLHGGPRPWVIGKIGKENPRWPRSAIFRSHGSSTILVVEWLRTIATGTVRRVEAIKSILALLN
jgi:hypothetical protein